jgi:hypothetical protein
VRSFLHAKMWALAAMIALAVAAKAQTSRDLGTVTDPSGAVVIGASVVMTRSKPGRGGRPNSNDAGILSFRRRELESL